MIFLYTPSRYSSLDNAFYQISERFGNIQMLEEGEIQITCKPNFRKQCSLDWHDLETIDNEYPKDDLMPNKWCKSCKKTVHYVSTPEELEHHRRKGNCVAVYTDRRMLLGDICLPDYIVNKSLADLDDCEL